MSKRSKMCGRCARTWETTKRDPNVFCPDCETATADQRLFALVFVDGSGILSIHEDAGDAFGELRRDVEACGISRVRFVSVVGQAGARAELNARRLADVNGELWDRIDAASDRADFEASQEMFR